MPSYNITLSENEKKILRAWRDGADTNSDVRRITGLTRNEIQTAYNEFRRAFDTFNMKEQARRANAAGLI